MKAKIFMLPICMLMLSVVAFSQGKQDVSLLWTDVPEVSISVPEAAVVLLPDKFRLLKLHASPMQAVLKQAPEREKIRQSPVLLEVPLPDGQFQQFRIGNAQVMHPDLAAKFPEIRSYAGIGVDNPAARIYFSVSPLGFNALVLLPGTNMIFIEPVHHTDTEHYLCYYQRHLDPSFLQGNCSVPDMPEHFQVNTTAESALAGDCQLRSYDAAIAATAEFTAAAGGVAGALANLNAIITVVSGLFTTEAAIQLQLVANNNLILFTNAGTDNLTDGNQNTLAGESQAAIESQIAANAYDIGHTVGTGGGGWAGVSQQIGNVCTGNKADAATIFGTIPLTNGFAMAFWHEMGHQFGARHTFNDNTTGSCTPGQQSASSAMEPGSGSTIMSYAGTCGVLNNMDVTNSRDQYYHALSLQQIGNYVVSGNGNTCPDILPLANNAPVVSAPGASFNVPISTPFMLTATANDPDGDPMTFVWEQMNNELISHPPASTATEGPVFRSLIPGNSPTRFFPNLTAILNGTTPVWEVLPSVSRTMDFRVTARDNFAAGGCTDEADVDLEFFDNAGPFVVTAPGMDACFAAEGPMTVDWDVAGTDGGDVNCANVDILLSIDGGFTYPFTLLAGTPNDGTQEVMLPDVLTEQARVMVRGSGNVFFNISPFDFEIQCISNLVVTDDPAIGTYEAREQVSTMGTVTVPAFATTEFLAGVEVLLNPGFSALLNCDFLARIQPCDACVGNRPVALAQSSAEEPNPVVHIHYVQSIDNRSDSGASARSLQVFPNPFNDNFTVRFDLEKSGLVYLELVDVTGRQVQRFYEQQYLNAGTYQFKIPVGQLAAGLYDCRLVSDSGIEQVKLVKLK